MTTGLTAYAKAEARLRSDCHCLKVDWKSLEKPILPCDLQKCKAACCHDGVELHRDDVEVLFRVIEENPHFFQETIRDFPEDCFERRPSGSWKTTTKPSAQVRSGSEFPTEFPATACVFLTDDSLCALQVLAMKEERHPWYYKPIPCWLHPLKIINEQVPVLRLVDDVSDPQKSGIEPGFASKTPCGIHRGGCGFPGKSVLAEEIGFLEDILLRKL